MISAEKALAIIMVNELKTLYVSFLHTEGMREYVLKKLKNYVTGSFADIIVNYYNQPRSHGFAASCSFSVPPIEEMVEAEDGSVSFEQLVHIQWSGGHMDHFTVMRKYKFKRGVIVSDDPDS